MISAPRLLSSSPVCRLPDRISKTLRYGKFSSAGFCHSPSQEVRDLPVSGVR